mmetsp:Transcript_59599/g.174339  ORF Transcript_59599/g.174339 Transcript_59599/m.174339 type:complete len:303 (-) Transcript_59599:968-1876(-)
MVPPLSLAWNRRRRTTPNSLVSACPVGPWALAGSLRGGASCSLQPVHSSSSGSSAELPPALSESSPTSKKTHAAAEPARSVPACTAVAPVALRSRACSSCVAACAYQGRPRRPGRRTACASANALRYRTGRAEGSRRASRSVRRCQARFQPGSALCPSLIKATIAACTSSSLELGLLSAGSPGSEAGWLGCGATGCRDLATRRAAASTGSLSTLRACQGSSACPDCCLRRRAWMALSRLTILAGLIVAASRETSMPHHCRRKRFRSAAVTRSRKVGMVRASRCLEPVPRRAREKLLAVPLVR